MAGLTLRYTGDTAEIMKWLTDNIECDKITPSGRTGFKRDTVVFGLYTTQKLVYLKNEQDIVLFTLRWL